MHITSRQTAEIDELREGTNGNCLVSTYLCSVLFLPRSEKEKRRCATNVKPKNKRNICFLSSSLGRALINKFVVIGQIDVFSILILDERVSNRIYANQIHLACIYE